MLGWAERRALKRPSHFVSTSMRVFPFSLALYSNFGASQKGSIAMAILVGW
jgi:hypothetical protein